MTPSPTRRLLVAGAAAVAVGGLVWQFGAAGTGLLFPPYDFVEYWAAGGGGGRPGRAVGGGGRGFALPAVRLRRVLGGRPARPGRARPVRRGGPPGTAAAVGADRPGRSAHHVEPAVGPPPGHGARV